MCIVPTCKLIFTFCQMRLGVTTAKIRVIVLLYLHDEHGLVGVELDHVVVVLDYGAVFAPSDDVLDLASVVYLELGLNGRDQTVDCWRNLFVQMKI